MSNENETPKETPVYSLWFDKDGNGPIPMGGTLELHVAVRKAHKPGEVIDAFTSTVTIEADHMGGLVLTNEDAKLLAKRLLQAAEVSEELLAVLSK